ncbi:regulatory protein RecX [Sphingomonas faeni]|uniref:regulatory protein RecX n=1 Tax=Sphingomonas faeni TaxID=185950 RepID=UPI00336509AB
MPDDDDHESLTTGTDGQAKGRFDGDGKGQGFGKNRGSGKDRGDRRSRERPAPKPFDAAALETMALRYVERFATTRGRLTDYLKRKIREREWGGAPTDPAAPTLDPVGLAQRMADLGYIDDRAFAEQRAAAMQRRGLGGRRVAGAFREAGIDEGDAESIAPAIEDRAIDSALAFARRKRIGPYGTGDSDRKSQDKQLAAMIRAGHRFDLARRIVAAPPSDTVESSDFE